jgi:Flp pilus assembly protein TadG
VKRPSFGADARGSSLIEFALLVPVFLMVIVGLMGAGGLMWAQFGLQHGAEMAARCASVNATTCGTTANIKTYAANQTYGVNPPTSAFTVSTPSCGKQVVASYSYQLLALDFGLPAITLSAKSCFPK